jgi:hypothetical protein
LVQADDGLFYAWRTASKGSQDLSGAGLFPVPADELELASEQQVFMGRDPLGKVSVGSVMVEFRGLVSRGKVNFRALVTEPGGSKYFTVVIPAGDVPERGCVFEASRLGMTEARADQVAAGLGVGTLRRNSKKRGVREG